MVETVMDHLESKLNAFLSRNGLNSEEIRAIASKDISKFRYVTKLDIADLYGDPLVGESEDGLISAIYEVKMLELVSKTSNSGTLRHTAYHLTERGAAKDVDITLIKHGRSPVNVLKKVGERPA